MGTKGQTQSVQVQTAFFSESTGTTGQAAWSQGSSLPPAVFSKVGKVYRESRLHEGFWVPKLLMCDQSFQETGLKTAGGNFHIIQKSVEKFRVEPGAPLSPGIWWVYQEMPYFSTISAF